MRSVLITGANKGIGLATSLLLARSGYIVHATMRDLSRSCELTDTAEKEGLTIRNSALDVNSDASVSEAVGAIQGEHGPIDILINNAGIARRGSIEELPISEFRALIETNYFGAVRCIQAVMPEMRRRKSGCIINVSSVGGRIASPPLTAYAASKWALEAMSEGLAQEAKVFNIRVAVVEPGIIDTGMSREIASEPDASAYPQGRRMAGLFSAALAEQPTPTSVVAEKILEIIESGSWKFRHTAGPDAEAYIQRRFAMSDEEWIARGAATN
ncbi:MAG TPA: SDR family oxidoreductase [Terriglobia bacterium]|jgi:NAD(P)-dependent dehydrogenase (short-subunit alcohol dehydrogenase family)